MHHSKTKLKVVAAGFVIAATVIGLIATLQSARTSIPSVTSEHRSICETNAGKQLNLKVTFQEVSKVAEMAQLGNFGQGHSAGNPPGTPPNPTDVRTNLEGDVQLVCLSERQAKLALTPKTLEIFRNGTPFAFDDNTAVRLARGLIVHFNPFGNLESVGLFNESRGLAETVLLTVASKLQITSSTVTPASSQTNQIDLNGTVEASFKQIQREDGTLEVSGIRPGEKIVSSTSTAIFTAPGALSTLAINEERREEFNGQLIHHSLSKWNFKALRPRPLTTTDLAAVQQLAGEVNQMPWKNGTWQALLTAAAKRQSYSKTLGTLSAHEPARQVLRMAARDRNSSLGRDAAQYLETLAKPGA
jgi:hypothetical protein